MRLYLRGTKEVHDKIVMLNPFQREIDFVTDRDMSLTQLTLQDFKGLQRLLLKKEKLVRKVNEIDRRLDGITGRSGGGLGSRRSITGGGRKGLLKAKVVKALQAAGKKGLHVVDLAKKVDSPVPNIRVWFYATGKKIKQIKQTAPATYAWTK